MTRWQHCLAALAALVLIGALPPLASAQFTDPFVRLEFDQFIPDDDGVHTDTHRLVVFKPIKTLTLSMTSSGIPEFGGMHLAGSEILLDLSNATILDSTNTASQLSVSVIFNDALPVGTHPATKVVFGYEPDYFHDTLGVAYGTFVDGQSFYVETFAGFIPEPSSFVLLALGASLVSWRGRRRRF